uniref:Uncharacterized protein n=1 Tax=Cuerna arida TaxID=1464854 RepID=A0A1B6H495_9HEMI
MAGNDNEELFPEAFDKCEDGERELEQTGPKSDGEQICSICNNKLLGPRLLSCLHVFCLGCLEKIKRLVENGREMIVCPKCQQETYLGRKGVLGLSCDYISTNIQDMLAIISMAVVCTSCKTKEKAVSRCSDCAHFLCPNCDTAHQYMRCFENHKVVSFEVLKKAKEAVPIHKPVFCEFHITETMKFFCNTCSVTICNECVVVDHCAPDHHYERLSDAYERHKEHLQNLMGESKTKMAYCEDATNSLSNALAELQAQHDNAKGLINETFQSYKALLEKRKDDVLDELKELHSERELKIMEMFHVVEKSVERIEDASKFTQRLLEHGSPAEVLCLRQLVSTQLLNLINNTPKPDVNTTLEFVTDMDKFTAAIQATFGHFRKPESPVGTATTTPQQESPPPPSLSLVTNNVNCPPSSVTSSPVSMPSSYEGELALPPLLPLTSIQEYNLSALASLAEAPSQVSGAPSPTSSFSLSDLLCGDITSSTNAIKNLEALVKLGNVSLNEPGESGVSYPKIILPANPYKNPTTTRLFFDSFFGDLVNGAAGPAPLIGRGSPIDGIPPVLSPVNGASFPRSSPTAILSSANAATNSGMLPPVTYNVNRIGTKSAQAMQVRYKFGTLGPGKGQFNSPHGFCLGTEEDIIVADTNNHRIQVFEKCGSFKFQFGIPGKEEGQLWYPRKVAVMKASGKFVVCDRGNERSRMQIFTKNGHFIKKIAIRYIDIVAGLAVSSQGHIVAVDSVSPTVFVISDNGDLLSWFDCSDHMREPSDLAINGKEYFVCDFKGHCVVVFNENGSFLRRIGCENLTNFPNGIDISDAGDVLVGDSHGNRFHVAVFNRNGEAICEFECPYVKVSRCCGLKITSEGFIVTLAKNNHHVLVLNTLYIV